LARIARHRVWASRSLAPENRFGLLGKPVRLVDAPLRVNRFSEFGYGGAEAPAVSMRLQFLAAFSQFRFCRGRIPGGHFDVTHIHRGGGWLDFEFAEQSLGTPIAARACAKRPA
jgi:hypothetical protein